MSSDSKLVLLEAIPNEVRRGKPFRSITSQHSSSFAPSHGRRNEDLPTWFLHPIGKLSSILRNSVLNVLVSRYDLNSLFAKAFGNFSVNVQGLSRVCTTFSNSQGIQF